MTTLIIAEAGVNHNGDLELALSLVDAAKEAGADYVKFQTFTADSLVTRTARKAQYQQRCGDIEESQYDMLRRIELTPKMHYVLSEHCEQIGIGFLSTGFDIASLDFLLALGIPMFKIPSGEITNLPYLRHVGSMGKPIIISVGMANMNEIGDALRVLQEAGTQLRQITVLHCNTQYPTPMCDVNLRAMLTIRKTYGVNVGYSDHTMGIEVSIAAVALGANIIEKHFTLDRRMQGPDHNASLEPSEFQSMVKAIRNVEVSLGDGLKVLTPSEENNILVARKSIVAGCAISKGQIFTHHNLAVKRPAGGISPMRWDEILGLTAIRDYSPDDLITLK